MKHLGSLKGRGQLRRGGNSVGEVDYDLSVIDTGRSRGASGTLQGDGRMLIDAFMEDGEHSLLLADGQVMGIVITNVESDTARAESNGPVPGF